MTSVQTVYVYSVNGGLNRRPARNPYVLISQIKEDIKKAHNLPYDFDLTYNGQEVSENTSLIDNNFLESIPLCVIPRKVTPLVYRSRNDRQPESSISNPFLHRMSRARQHGTLIFKNLINEFIDDETEQTSKTSCQSTNKYHWEPSIEIHSPPVMPFDEEQCIDVPSITPREHLTSQFQRPHIEKPLEETSVQPMGASRNSSYLATVRVTGPVNIALSENSITITPRFVHAKGRYDVSKKLSVQHCRQSTENHSYSLEKDAADDTDLIEIEENLPDQGNSSSNVHYHITF